VGVEEDDSWELVVINRNGEEDKIDMSDWMGLSMYPELVLEH
jgi:hypothetical protein